MLRAGWILAVLAAGAAWAQAPSYSADGIIKASDYTPGPFAPNSLVSIYGSNLSWYTQAAATDGTTTDMPTSLGYVSVYVDNVPAALLYVSPTQINFIVPCTEIDGNSTVVVVRQSVSGPPVSISLVDGAPALFWTASGHAIATNLAGTVLTPDNPAHAGDIIVVYATGLGKTEPNLTPTAIPQTAASIVGLPAFKVYLDGQAVDPIHIKYAGRTPFTAGVYQVNLELPADVGTDPEVRLSIGSQVSAAGLNLVVR